MLTKSEQQLLQLGSVEALALHVGAEEASDAMYTLSLRVPEEIRGLWDQVIAYNQLQQAYEVAQELGDSDAMIRAVKARNDIIERHYR